MVPEIVDISPRDRTDTDELDRIVYHLSHDLRASIRALRELPDWLTEDLGKMGVDLDGEPEDTLRLIRSHALRLDNMLNGLLSYSRIGRLQEVAVMKPQRVFEEVLRGLDPPETARIFTHFTGAEVRMGSADLARVFQILLSNALTHGAGDPHQIEVTACASGRVWELLVADTGPGIPEKNWGEVFNPMTKLVSRDEHEGSGMGLAILNKIVEHYGGTVHVEGRRRRGGISFRVRLPVLAA